MKFVQISIFIIIALTAFSHTSMAQSNTSQEYTGMTKTIEIKVKGVTCAMDLKTISANVEKLEGVESCKPGKKGATSTFNVTMNTALVSEKAIHAAIENTAGCKNPNDRPYKVKG